MAVGRPCIFIDRDDTLIYDVPYLNDPERVELTPGAAETLAALKKIGFLVIVVTNQSGIGRGILTVEQMEAVNARVLEKLSVKEASVDKIFFCPHRPDEGCSCRKPGTGMLEQACSEFDIDLSRSAVVGDSSADIGMGKAFGVKTVQVRLPGKNKADAGADIAVESLPEALDFLKVLF